jgi:hypothetical protein
MKTSTIFDRQCRVLAMIDHHSEGHRVLRGPNRAVHAFYDADADCTRDSLNRFVARGDQIERLVSLLCVRTADGR